MQETRVNPIQFDNTTAQLLVKMGDMFMQDSAQKQKLAQDNERLSYERAKLIQDLKQKREEKATEIEKSLYPQFNAAGVSQAAQSQYIGDTFTKVRSMLDKNTPLPEIQASINADISKAQQQDIAFNTPLKMIDDFAKSLPADEQKDFLSEKAKNYILQMHTYQDPATGKIKWRDADQMINPNELINVMLTGPESYQFWGASGGRKVIDKDLKAQDPTKLSVSKRDQNGLVRTGEKVDVEFNPLIQQWNDKTGKIELKTDANGFINDEAWKKYSAAPQVQAWLNKEALEIAQAYNGHTADERKAVLANSKIGKIAADGSLPEAIAQNSESFENIKKAVLTNYLQHVSNDVIKTAESKTIVTNNTFGMQPVPADQALTAPMDRVRAILKGDTNYLGTASKSTQGNTTYDVTEQFSSLPLFKSHSGKTYGPSEVQFNPSAGGKEPMFYVRAKKDGTLKAYTPQQFGDLIEPKTGGTGYDTKPKPKGNVR